MTENLAPADRLDVMRTGPVATARDGLDPIPDDRFARHALIEGWDQKRLGEATVVVVGVGALGNEVARILTMAGVGQLVLCDPDVVATSNLSRTVLFRPADVGRLKAEAAAAALAELAPGVLVDARPVPLLSGVGLAELRDADLVISCLDSRAARISLATRCTLVGAALLDGGTRSWGGEARLYKPGGSCYGCWLTPALRAAQDDPHSCLDPDPVAPVGASAPVSALTGAWLAMFAIRLLFGWPVPRDPLAIDPTGAAAVGLAEHSARDPDCPLHETIPPEAISRLALTHEATVEQLRQQLAPDELAIGWTTAPPSDAEQVVLSAAAPHSRLRALGVAPGEILTVVRPSQPDQLRFVELATAATRSTNAG